MNHNFQNTEHVLSRTLSEQNTVIQGGSVQPVCLSVSWCPVLCVLLTCVWSLRDQRSRHQDLRRRLDSPCGLFAAAEPLKVTSGKYAISLLESFLNVRGIIHLYFGSLDSLVQSLNNISNANQAQWSAEELQGSEMWIIPSAHLFSSKGPLLRMFTFFTADVSYWKSLVVFTPQLKKKKITGKNKHVSCSLIALQLMIDLLNSSEDKGSHVIRN